MGNIRFSKTRLKYFRKNWKLGVHLLFRTKRFGVNNEAWPIGKGNSIFGWSNWKIFWSIIKIKPIIQNWKAMKFRAGACHFLSDESYEIVYDEKKNKKLDEWYKKYEKTESKKEKDRNKRMEEKTKDGLQDR